MRTFPLHHRSSRSPSAPPSIDKQRSHSPFSDENSRIRHPQNLQLSPRPSDIVIEGKLRAFTGEAQAHCASASETSATLTKSAFFWDSHVVQLKDVIAVSCCAIPCQFTLHSYSEFATKWVPRLFGVACRKLKNFCFVVPDADSLLKWINAFSKEGCFVNGSSCVVTYIRKDKQKVVDIAFPATLSDFNPSRAMLVILNPCSGRGQARSIFYEKVEPIFKMSGFKLKVVETNSTGHARSLLSTMDLNFCSAGIICIGGDGTVNEVLNGLCSREDVEHAMKIPVGVIPSGSDNSLVWSILGIRDPVAAAIAIVKGRIMAMDVFVAKWTTTGTTHLGHTIVYHGFMSDVLKCSARYKERFGPLRYFIAGFLKFLSLPKYNFEVHYIPMVEQNQKVFTGVGENASWVVRRGSFLGLMICNHKCKTVQCLKSQTLAPLAQYDDGSLDLMIIPCISHFQLLLFLFLMQFNRQLLLPFVDYAKVQCVTITTSENSQQVCGVDGELLKLNGRLLVSLFPHKLLLMGLTNQPLTL